MTILPLKIDSTLTKDGRLSKMSNLNTHNYMPIISEGGIRETKLVDALKNQMNKSFNKRGYIVNNKQLGKLSKMHIPEEAPDSPAVISHKRKKLQI